MAQLENHHYTADFMTMTEFLYYQQSKVIFLLP